MLNVLFPLGGLNRQGAYRQQPPYTTYDALNVWPREQISKRVRGGSRPGLERTHPENLGGDIRLLDSIVFLPGVTSTGARDDGVFVCYDDNFERGELSGDYTHWEGAMHGPHLIGASPPGYKYIYDVYQSGDKTGTFYSVGNLCFSKPMSFAIQIIPDDAGYGGDYNLYLNMSPAGFSTTYRVGVTFHTYGDSGAFSGAIGTKDPDDFLLLTNVGHGFTSAEIGWLILVVDDTDVKVYWRGFLAGSLTLESSPTWQAGRGFVLETSSDYPNADCRVGAIRIQGYRDVQSITDPYALDTPGLRIMLVASAAGDLYYEKLYGNMEAVTTDVTLNENRLLQSAQIGQKLYIADYGDLRISGDDGTVSGFDLDAASVDDWTALSIDADDDVVVISNVGDDTVAQTYRIDSIAAGALTLTEAPGDGTCTYRVERAPKVYDPNENTLEIFTASVGQVPTGNPLMARYIDRMVLAGSEIAPQIWYMSRQGDETDWDYSQSDSQRAIAGTTREAGVPGGCITALVPYKDDYLLIGCLDSLWLMRGDPGYGGSLDNVSKNVGVVGKAAWCVGPNGEFIFLSRHGIYVLPSIQGGTMAIPFSDKILPAEFKNVNASRVVPSMQYDSEHDGIHVFLTSASDEPGTHWFIDWGTKTFWPIAYAEGCEPTCTHIAATTGHFGNGVILGGKDGYLRRFDDLTTTDDGTSFVSYVLIGPIPLAPDGFIGKVMRMDAIIAENSGDVSWALRAGDTFEAAITSSDDLDTGTWIAGLNATVWPACAGQACVLVVTGALGEQWAMEQILVAVSPMGPRRLA